MDIVKISLNITTKMQARSVFWLAFLCLFPQTIKLHAEDRLYITVHKNGTILEAAGTGNRDEIQNELNKGKTSDTYLLAKSIEARVNFDLQKSADVAKTCYEQSIVASSLEKSLACGQLWLGNLLLAGDIRSWALNSIKIKSIIYPALAKATGKNNVGVRGLEMANYEDLIESPEPSINKSSTIKSVIPWKISSTNAKEYSFHPAFIEILVNGNKIQAIFDTGSQFSILSKDDAKKANVTLKSSHFVSMRAAGGEDIGESSLGVIESLKLGDSSIRNLPIAILNGKYSVIGLDIIRKVLPKFRISDSGIRPISSKDDSRCQSNLELLSGLAGEDAKLLMHIKIDNLQQDVILDTGTNLPLVGDRTTAVNNDSPPLNTTTFEGPSIQRTVHFSEREVQVAPSDDETHKSVPLRSITDRTMLKKFSLGIGISKYYDIAVDFDSHKACLVNRK